MNDDYFEVQESATLALFLLGTPAAMDLLFRINENEKKEFSPRLLWCLKRWSGLTFYELAEYHTWWSTNRGLIQSRTLLQGWEITLLLKI